MPDDARALKETSKLLVEYFGKIPPHQLSDRIAYTFRAFDADQSGYLERFEPHAVRDFGRGTRADLFFQKGACAR